MDKGAGCDHIFDRYKKVGAATVLDLKSHPKHDRLSAVSVKTKKGHLPFS